MPEAERPLPDLDVPHRRLHERAGCLERSIGLALCGVAQCSLNEPYVFNYPGGFKSPRGSVSRVALACWAVRAAAGPFAPGLAASRIPSTAFHVKRRPSVGRGWHALPDVSVASRSSGRTSPPRHSSHWLPFVALPLCKQNCSVAYCHV